MGPSATSIFSATRVLLVASGLLLGSCRPGNDEAADVHAPGAPATMMSALHTMAEHSKALPPPPNLDLYFALLMRENHRAAVAMSALELQRGQDATLRKVAQHQQRAHQHLIVGLDSAIQRLQALPPAFPEHTPQSERLARLLEAATSGLHPAAHRIIARLEGGQDSATPHLSQQQEDAGTGSIDRDFAALLVPHHQNSMTLARAELELGRDDVLQKEAYLILQDQQREIEQVQAWLRQHPAPAKP